MSNNVILEEDLEVRPSLSQHPLCCLVFLTDMLSYPQLPRTTSPLMMVCVCVNMCNHPVTDNSSLTPPLLLTPQKLPSTRDGWILIPMCIKSCFGSLETVSRHHYQQIGKHGLLAIRFDFSLSLTAVLAAKRRPMKSTTGTLRQAKVSGITRWMSTTKPWPRKKRRSLSCLASGIRILSNSRHRGAVLAGPRRGHRFQ